MTFRATFETCPSRIGGPADGSRAARGGMTPAEYKMTARPARDVTADGQLAAAPHDADPPHSLPASRPHRCARVLGRRGRGAWAVVLALLVVLLGSTLPRSESVADPAAVPPPPRLADVLRKRGERPRACSSGHLRLAGGGSGLGWIERRLNTVFSSASKASGSPSLVGAQSQETGGSAGAAHLATQTPAEGKPGLWGRFERGFDSLQGVSTVGKDPFRSLSPMSSPEGPYQASDGDASPSRQPSRKMTSWIARRFNDAFASDAPSPGDVSQLSHGAVFASYQRPGHEQQRRNGAQAEADSRMGPSSGTWTEAGQQAQQQSRQPLHAEANLRSEHQAQHGSEVSEEADAGGSARNMVVEDRDKAQRVKERAGVEGSFMLRINKRLVEQDSVSDSCGRGSVGDMGLPTPLRAEWGPALNAGQVIIECVLYRMCIP